jgi:hypothetical protein
VQVVAGRLVRMGRLVLGVDVDAFLESARASSCARGGGGDAALAAAIEAFVAEAGA